MKAPVLIGLVALSAISFSAFAQKKFNNKPLLLAGTDRADILIGEDWYSNRWRVSPQIERDSMKLKLYGKSEDFGFRTDKDSLRFKIRTRETRSFYVKLGDAAPAFTLISAEPYVWDNIVYEKGAEHADLKFYFQGKDDAYFDSLRKQYPLDAQLAKDKSDQERVLSIMNWTHHQWKHDGSNAPKGSDGISILNEAKAGGRFPCFAYAIVLRDQLIAHGLPARVLYLKTKDAEVRKGSPGHVATEVYLKDRGKWVFIDGQFNVMPMLNGKPLNAVEFQEALSKSYDKVVLASRDQVSKRYYTEFVYDYLYYLDTAVDNRIAPAGGSVKLGGMRSVMLVPVGAPDLKKISFWNSVVDYCLYTRSLKDFYPVLN
ncbi:transglutaminase-like domain-containing protein [Pedobacter sp. PLR]|uniref:transglutaminase-like domain-containing protein n=1 Tax=Pedobacter sp. PLR TaxID=2994465 RepID=UPI0022461AD5|nr:transglutaminase-like domain-containing protein [Pedobacter sp. PLR]MCX2450009.1 transglutaminase-like domain-containing protein [Pedobacter sp. PLR]